ncbi:PREDICTED: protein ENL-like [Nicotiana attenuata]|uniref:protein ENL-like n=1 Tax=Nicotiana attenuata TaxID=49451 RepID=UPI000905AA59|nr:PREDICTED: protein ENL-like [Nicotiana attenuata]
MTNPQDNPGTPPPVSPSNTSSSTPPVENPKPSFRRQKMLARKTVASGAFRKALNEKLKASQKKESPAKESDSSSESEAFISVSEGEQHGSFDTDKNQETPGEVDTCFVFSDVVEKEDNRFVLVGPLKDVKEAESSRKGKKRKDKILAICGRVEESGNKSGGSGSGEAAEGLLHLSKQQDEHGSFVEETLADILKKGRATRSRVKQSEEELQKALEESKKKKREKERKKLWRVLRLQKKKKRRWTWSITKEEN